MAKCDNPECLEDVPSVDCEICPPICEVVCPRCGFTNIRPNVAKTRKKEPKKVGRRDRERRSVYIHKGVLPAERAFSS
jgi:uncharacterized protein (DUF2225 family)